MQKKTLFSILLFTSILIILSSFRLENKTVNNSTTEPVINWNKKQKLNKTDFNSSISSNIDNAVANTATGFGYSITDSAGTITGSIFVRFYPEKSWWNADRIQADKADYILKHEQIHFDICELFGRKLFKEITQLANSGKLNDRNIERMYLKLEKQYSRYQNKYDKETNHSINRVEQYYWSNHIKRELKTFEPYSNYTSFTFLSN